MKKLDGFKPLTPPEKWEAAKGIDALYRSDEYLAEACDMTPATRSDNLSDYAGRLLGRRLIEVVNMIDQFPLFEQGWENGRLEELWEKTMDAMQEEERRKRVKSAVSKMPTISPRKPPAPWAPLLPLSGDGVVSVDPPPLPTRGQSQCPGCASLQAKLSAAEATIKQLREDIEAQRIGYEETIGRLEGQLKVNSGRRRALAGAK